MISSDPCLSPACSVAAKGKLSPQPVSVLGKNKSSPVMFPQPFSSGASLNGEGNRGQACCQPSPAPPHSWAGEEPPNSATSGPERSQKESVWVKETFLQATLGQYVLRSESKSINAGNSQLVSHRQLRHLGLITHLHPLSQWETGGPQRR